MAGGVGQIVEGVGLVGAGGEVEGGVEVVVLPFRAGTCVEQQRHQFFVAIPRCVMQARTTYKRERVYEYDERSSTSSPSLSFAHRMCALCSAHDSAF